MSKNSNLGGSSNMRTQIQNLWQAINTIESGGGGGGGTGNVNFTPNSGTIGSHYKISSSNGENCVESSINETNTDFTFGNKNLGAIGDITADKLVISGGTIQQYLMADGTLLQQSATGGNSNFYLYNNHSNTTTPPPINGDVGYNNAVQNLATILYISHRTRDTIDIEVFYNQITQLNDVYIQDQENSVNFIRYNITAPPTIVPNSYISIPVVKLLSGGTGATSFGNGHNILVSFFSNLPEIDSRLSTLETKTQNQSAVSNQTDFAGTIQADTIKISASSPNLHLMSDGSTRDITTVTNGGPVGGQSLVKIGYGTNPSIQLNSVSAFNGVGLTLNNGNISFSNTATISNAGILEGLSLVSNGTAPNYSLKSLNGMNGCIVSEASNVITVSNSSPASGISLANAGSGTSLISSTSTNPNFRTKSITQGSGILISDVSNNLTISTTTPYLPLSGGTMSGDIDLSGNQLINFNSISQASGRTLNVGNNSVSYNTSSNVVVGTTNTSNANEQWIFGAYNNISSNISVAVGSYNTVNSFNGNALGRANTVSAGYSNAIGMNNTCSGTYSVAIGNDIINSTPNSVCLGDNAITTIYPNSLVCDLGTSAKPYKDIYYSGKLVNASSLPDLTSEYKPNIWYYITTTATFIGGVFTASTQITAIGGTLTQIATSNTNWRTRKSGRINCPTTIVADGARSGFIGTATFPAIYSGSGWFFSFDFSITDPNVSATACTRMFVGFGITTIAPSLATGVAINSLQNMIGIGHDNGDSVLSFYSRGPSVGTANGNKIATTFSCATPSTKIFTATFYSPTNSDDIVIKLYDQETRTSAYQTFTLGGTLTPISTSPLIPVWVRAMAPVSGGAITNSAQLGLNGFKWYTL